MNAVNPQFETNNQIENSQTSAVASKPSAFARVPNEIIEHLFKNYLNDKDLLAIRLVSRKFCVIADKTPVRKMVHRALAMLLKGDDLASCKPFLERAAFGFLSLSRFNLDPSIHHLADIISNNEKVHTARFKYCSIEDDSFERFISRIQGAGHLKILEFIGGKLRSNSITPLTVFMKNAGGLEELNLSGNYIDDKGIKHLAEHLKYAPRLLALKLNHNNFGDEGMTALAEAIESHPRLKKIGVVGSKCTKACLPPFFQAMKKQRRIERIKFSSSEMRDASSCEPLYLLLSTSDQLKELSLRNVCASQQPEKNPFAFLTVNCALTSLTLRSCTIGDDHGPSLEEGLSKCKALKKLDLEGNDLGGKAIAHLAGGLMSGSLKTLNLTRNSLGGEGATHLRKILALNPLERLTVEHCMIDCQGALAIKEGILEGNTLLFLDIHLNEIKQIGALALAEVIEKSSLIKMDASLNSIPKEGLCALINAHYGSRTLNELNLEVNQYVFENDTLIKRASERGKRLIIDTPASKKPYQGFF